MPQPLFFLTIPGLRRQDLERMPHIQKLASGGEIVGLKHTFPCVTWPAQTHMLTGKTDPGPRRHCERVLLAPRVWREAKSG